MFFFVDSLCVTLYLNFLIEGWQDRNVSFCQEVSTCLSDFRIQNFVGLLYFFLGKGFDFIKLKNAKF